ncbi:MULTISPECIES: efflux RND transporter periplasmic adaptor subunit [Glaesserella]|uniref:Efflux transporter periplasmic adaptor subunit n=1 Tax=Glaesserella australis TaxID=2094024 RepID=A0A328C0H8_9PAST|nr:MULTISPECIES: efflux RND transporter periplasmic adaptor subunit [Glaesserella]AUI66361.1 efflux transporter periplasmic adaptor subunit [Glaesserella sp. 15-184]RAL19425.1 efflux transporter periplasmic adaptor subunit [Glaesserella australis]
MKILKPLLLIMLLAGAGIIGYNYVNTGENQQIHYITEASKIGNLDKSVLATGSIRANQRTEVGAQVSGKIQKLHVVLGQSVKKGELIAEIDSETQQNNLNTAQAELLAYKTQLNAKQVALNVAESNYQRLSKLYAQKSTSLNDLEAAKNELVTAKANLEDVKSKIQVAEISVNTAKTNLGYTNITSPIDGIIVSMPVSEGQTVNSNQTSPTIVQVADLSKVLVKLEIAEGDIAQVKADQSVSFTTLAEPNRYYQGKIKSIDPALTTLTDNSYTEASGNSNAVYYYANVVVDNPDMSLRIGMTTQGKVIIAERNGVLLIPTTAIKKREKENIVQILENGKAIEKSVQIGLSDSQYTEIISGLTEGEQVITTQRSADEQIGNNNMRIRF